MSAIGKLTDWIALVQFHGDPCIRWLNLHPAQFDYHYTEKIMDLEFYNKSQIGVETSVYRRVMAKALLIITLRI